MSVTGTGIGGIGGAEVGKVASKILEGMGHLLTMESVAECVDIAAPGLAVH